MDTSKVPGGGAGDAARLGREGAVVGWGFQLASNKGRTGYDVGRGGKGRQDGGKGGGGAREKNKEWGSDGGGGARGVRGDGDVSGRGCGWPIVPDGKRGAFVSPAAMPPARVDEAHAHTYVV